MQVANMYVIRDCVAKQSGPIFEAINHSVAMRQFIMMDIPDQFRQDYKLLCVGAYNHETDELDTSNFADLTYMIIDATEEDQGV